MIPRRTLRVAAALALCLAAAGCSKESDTPDARPVEPALPAGDGNGLNLLILTIDTLRADHLGAYGYARPTSPTIDRLAEKGTLFEQAYAPRGLTWPSLASLMTSRYPIQHGVRINGVVLDPAETTLAEILNAKGYSSAAYTAKNVTDQRWEGFETVQALVDTEIAEQGIAWLQSADETKPFFLWLHFFGPHKPYTPPEEYAQRFSPNYKGPFEGAIMHTDAITLHQKELDPADLAHITALYDALIARTDDLLATVLETLDSLGLTEKTLVVHSSDHGEDLYDHNKYFYHLASVYDSSLHIPLVFRLPGVVPEGVRVDSVVEMIDISPTILQLLGFSTAPSFEGTSLVPLFSGQRLDLGPAFSEWQDRILTIRTSEYRYVLNPAGFRPPWYSLPALATLRKQEFYTRMVESKLLDANIEQFDYPIKDVELYDMSRDPLRMVDDLGPYAGQISELTGLLQDWQQRYGWKWMSGISDEIDPDVQERLEALGYVF